ncbi:MAG TPA: DNA adenine methylase [Myxococcota bacterium]|nr:DNA adenine methylase [Myxococcota bacterium]
MQAVVAVVGPDESVPRVVARPFLKWAGGKRRIVPRLLERLTRPIGRYHEPFVGGGALFFSLAQRLEDRAERWATLTDMNLRLVRAYRGIKNDFDGVVERLDAYRAGHCETQYYATRGNDIDACSEDADVAAWMIYLNRTGFNGLYRVNKSGGFNVPLGRYDNPTILDEGNLRAVNRVLQNVEVRHADFTNVFFEAQRGDAVYFDPPYVPLSKTSNFTAYTKGGFGPVDQLRLRDIAWELKRRGVDVVLSNHDTAEVRELYRDFHIESVLVGRAINSKAGGRGKVAEVIIS